MSDYNPQERKAGAADSPTFSPSSKEGNETGDTQSLSEPPNTDGTAINPSECEDSARTLHGVKWVLVCASLYFSCMIYGLDGTIAADIQAAVVERFGNIEQLAWMGTGFPLGSVCFILPSATLYAKFDMKIIYIASVVIFEAGSALCGAAPNMNALIVGRVVAGVGGSGIYIGILNYFSMTTTLRERGFYMGLVGFFWGFGAILGPLVGGGFSSSAATWRWSFYINLLVAVLCAPIFLLYLPSMHASNSGLGVLKKLSQIDWTGLTLTAATIVCFSIALTFPGSTWQWNDGRTISVFVVFGALLVLTFTQQRFLVLTTRENRMFPPGHLFRSRTQVLLNIGMFLSAWALFVPLYYIPNYFQFVHGDSSILAAVRVLPFVVILIATALASGGLLPKLRYYTPLYTASGILILTGSCLMYTVSLDSPPSHVYGYSVLMAMGAGLTLNSGFAISGIDMSNRGGSAQNINDVVTLQNISQLSGTLLALLISGQVFQSLVFRNLKGILGNEGFTDAQIRSVAGGTRSVVFATLSPELAREAVDAITKAISKLYILTIVTGGVALIASFFLKYESLFKAKPTPTDDDIA